MYKRQAKILNEVKDELSGDVRLVFQPAEETAVGALRMMEEHALDGVNAIYGVHVWGTYDAPGIAFPAGNLMACCHGSVSYTHLDVYKRQERAS